MIKERQRNKGNMSEESKKTFTGVVDWFDPDKSFGFITRDDGKTDIFCHYSDIVMEGYKVVMSGDKVQFEEDFSFNGKLKAGNVVVTERKKTAKTVSK